MLTQTAGVLLTNSGTNGSASLLSMLLPFVILIAVFYFLLIRPENKKKKAAAKMRSELAVGDEITTIGGVVGTICQVKEDTIIIETSADRVRMEFTKWAISTKAPSPRRTLLRTPRIPRTRSNSERPSCIGFSRNPCQGRVFL